MNTSNFEWPVDKKPLYSLLSIRLRGLIDGIPHQISNLANASALLGDALLNINWVGFYLMREGRLVLGPFQGKPACIEIEIGNRCGKRSGYAGKGCPPVPGTYRLRQRL